jgi:pyridoxal phosphate enzyme (YggS family)
MSISENILLLKSQIPQQVTLIAVSKTKPNSSVLEAYQAGQKEFGENYVQELVDKQAELPKDINWHFIGHLQTNKVKYIAPFVYMIHGVDSIKLLTEINKEAKKNNRIINCLLQLYIAKEETKFGLDFEEASALLTSNTFLDLKHISIQGFMAMASNTDDEVQIENEFKSVVDFKNNFPQFPVLSIGMSSDYEIAIQQGSTHIRVGSLIFGERNYN